MTERLFFVLLMVVVLFVGCHTEEPPTGGGPSKNEQPSEFAGKIPDGIDRFTFFDLNKKNVRLADYRGKKNVVLVFMRGFVDKVCIYCQSQATRLIANHEEFERRDAEILVVYPGKKERIDDFIGAVTEEQSRKKQKIPFSVLVDEQLNAVEFFGIQGTLAKPSTFILDKTGKVRFAYVGDTVSDRPSIKELLKQLDSLADQSD